MKQCLRCSNMLTANASHCNVCNTIQKENFEEFDLNRPKTDTFLKVLCVLTIVGAGFSLLSLPFSFISSATLGIDYPIALIVLSGIIAAMKLIGAIYMLKKRLLGLHIYTVAAGCSVLSVIYSAISIDMAISTGFSILGTIFNLFFIFLFIVLYWLPVNRRVLTRK